MAGDTERPAEILRMAVEFVGVIVYVVALRVPTLVTESLAGSSLVALSPLSPQRGDGPNEI